MNDQYYVWFLQVISIVVILFGRVYAIHLKWKINIDEMECKQHRRHTSRSHTPMRNANDLETVAKNISSLVSANLFKSTNGHFIDTMNRIKSDRHHSMVSLNVQQSVILQLQGMLTHFLFRGHFLWFVFVFVCAFSVLHGKLWIVRRRKENESLFIWIYLLFSFWGKTLTRILSLQLLIRESILCQSKYKQNIKLLKSLNCWSETYISLYFQC